MFVCFSEFLLGVASVAVYLLNLGNFQNYPSCKTWKTLRNILIDTSICFATTTWQIIQCWFLDRALNSNNFTGEIPATLGNLSKLYWLDLADNQLTGSLPVSTVKDPGLDLLKKAKHLWVNYTISSFTIGFQNVYIPSKTLIFKASQPFQQKPAFRHNSCQPV